MMLLSELGNGERLAGMRIGQNERANFVWAGEQSIKNWRMVFDALRELFVAEKDEFAHVSLPARGRDCL